MQGGSARTMLIINCSPCADNAAETLSSLRFGSRALGIKNTAIVNRRLSPEALQRQLAEARAQVRLPDPMLALSPELPGGASCHGCTVHWGRVPKMLAGLQQPLLASPPCAWRLARWRRCSGSWRRSRRAEWSPLPPELPLPQLMLLYATPPVWARARPRQAGHGRLHGP